MIQTV